MATARERREGAHRRRDEARAAVIRAALELAESEPFAEITVAEIARAAGVSRTAFYVHFRGKSELLLAGMAETGEGGVVPEVMWRADGAPAEVVREAVSVIVSALAAPGGALRVAAEVSAYDGEVRAAWLATVQRFIEATASHIAAEQRRGLIPDGLDSATTAEALVWMAERCHDIYLARGGRSPEELVEQLVAVWTAALYPGVTPASEIRPSGPGGPIFGVPAPGFEGKR